MVVDGIAEASVYILYEDGEHGSGNTMPCNIGNKNEMVGFAIDSDFFDIVEVTTKLFTGAKEMLITHFLA